MSSYILCRQEYSWVSIQYEIVSSSEINIAIKM